MSLVGTPPSTGIIRAPDAEHPLFRDPRRQEIEQLTSEGKIPHDVEVEKHPEKSMEGRACESLILRLLMIRADNTLGLMGKVAGSIKVSTHVSNAL